MKADEVAKLITLAGKMTKNERENLRKERLHNLVEFTRKNSSFFMNLYKDLPENYSLSDIPPTSKKILMQDYEGWLTDHTITKTDVQNYLAADPITRGAFRGKYSVLATSGTTGEPMPMIRDEHRNLIHGTMLKLRLLREDIIGDLLDIRKHRRAAIVADDPKASAYSSFLRIRAANPGFEKNFICVPIRLPVDEKVKMLNDFQPEAISCYPSEMALMAIQQRKGLLKISPKVIVCSAEKLSDEMYCTLKETFNCTIINNYCMTEGGEIAFSIDCPHLHINDDWIIVEPVDENKNPVADKSKFSHGILITDLSNFVQPIIRYYVEDSVIIHDTCDCGNNFPWLEIHGRVSGVWEICGGAVTSMQLDDVTEIVDEALSVQLVQVGENDLQVRAILIDSADKNLVAEKILSEIKQLLRESGCENFNLEWNDEPPIKNVRGGKLSPFVRIS